MTTEATREAVERMMPWILYGMAVFVVLGIVGLSHDLWRRWVQWRKRRARAKRSEAAIDWLKAMKVGFKRRDDRLDTRSLAAATRVRGGAYVTVGTNCKLYTDDRITKPFAFQLGDPVQRSGGSYKFPGVVIGRSRKLDGVTALYTVECVVRGCQGVCHEFREEDLMRRRLGDPNEWEGVFLDEIMPDIAAIRDLCQELKEKRLNIRGHRGLENRLLEAVVKLDDMVAGYGILSLGTPLDAKKGTATGGGVR